MWIVDAILCGRSIVIVPVIVHMTINILAREIELSRSWATGSALSTVIICYGLYSLVNPPPILPATQTMLKYPQSYSPGFYALVAQ